MPIPIEQFNQIIDSLKEELKQFSHRLEIAETRLKERDKIVYDLVHTDVQAQGLSKMIQCIVVNFTTSIATGDGKFYFHIDKRLDLMNLVDVHAEVITAGTTNTLDIQIRNVTDSVDMLSTKLTIDSGATGSDTATAAAVIDKTKDDVAENDVIAIDIDAIHTTAAKGLIITLGFRLP